MSSKWIHGRAFSWDFLSIRRALWSEEWCRFWHFMLSLKGACRSLDTKLYCLAEIYRSYTWMLDESLSIDRRTVTVRQKLRFLIVLQGSLCGNLCSFGIMRMCYGRLILVVLCDKLMEKWHNKHYATFWKEVTPTKPQRNVNDVSWFKFKKEARLKSLSSVV